MIRALLYLFTFIMLACTPGGANRNPDPLHSNGGVDVGNMNSAAVPQTNASLSFSNNWTANTNGNVLSVQNKSGSVIEAKKSEITDLASPSALSLQQYLKAKYPDREYKVISINGIEGVRADLVDTGDAKNSDLYLVSELKDFIHLESRLKKNDNGIAEGEKILLTIRVKYQGVPYPYAQTKTVTLTARSPGGNGVDKHAYSPWGDCYTYSDVGCNPTGGVAIAYEGDFHIGTAGYDHGRVVELGPETQIHFDSIKIDGDYLVAPLSNVLISDIYTAFTPKDLHADQDHLALKEGYVYLVRTISWPGEDLILKMRVEKVDAGKSATITYRKLVYVERDELQKQVDAINKNTIDNEMPLSTGEVMLYNASVWNNYHYASFNFQYSTSGNMFITHNEWDLYFINDGYGKPSLTVPHTGGGLGQAVDVGTKDINSVTINDFPDPNTFVRKDTEVLAGHTYLVYHYDFGDYDAAAKFGAVQVLEVEPSGKWVRLKFKRLEIRAADYFQKWIHLNVPQGLQSVVLEQTNDGKTSTFYPFINKRADQGYHYYEDFRFRDYGIGHDVLTTDSRPYGPKRGFYNLGNTPLESVTVADIESLRGKFGHSLRIHNGDVIAVFLENYYDRTVLVMKVDDYVPNKSVKLSIKYLDRAKAPYSDDPD